MKDDPAGTVNPFTSMVVHFTAVDTSDSEDIVPVQSPERVCRPGAAFTVWNAARTIENQALVLAIMNGEEELHIDHERIYTYGSSTQSERHAADRRRVTTASEDVCCHAKLVHAPRYRRLSAAGLLYIAAKCSRSWRKQWCQEVGEGDGVISSQRAMP